MIWPLWVLREEEEAHINGLGDLEKDTGFCPFSQGKVDSEGVWPREDLELMPCVANPGSAESEAHFFPSPPHLAPNSKVPRQLFTPPPLTASRVGREGLGVMDLLLFPFFLMSQLLQG